MGKASQLHFIAKSFRQEIDSKESDSIIIEFQPLAIPNLHPCNIAKASIIATLEAFPLYLLAAKKRPESSRATTPQKTPPLTRPPTCIHIDFNKPGQGGIQQLPP